MLWKRRNAISTDTMAHEQHEVRDAYERGRRDERRARKRHPIMMSLTFAAALVGGWCWCWPPRKGPSPVAAGSSIIAWLPPPTAPSRW
uniref:Uncharacterized protein n=1 Tax=Phenylobacterium glaciei TaxID=2803784 RepID=A0A974P5G1_9CAUL|nr:hypothetical protein JKL49_04830 [Phenylobacterium glaciei]